ncbi:MAG TPA: hypothetical protein VGC10_07975 [Sphingomonas sp.]
MKRLLLGLAATALIAAAPPAPGRGDPDTGIDPPIGAAARARHGIEPLTRPTDDLGMAQDPPAGPPAGTAPAPVKTPAPASR